MECFIICFPFWLIKSKSSDVKYKRPFIYIKYFLFRLLLLLLSIASTVVSHGAAAAEGGDSRGSAVGDCEAAASFGGDPRAASGKKLILLPDEIGINKYLFKL